MHLVMTIETNKIDPLVESDGDKAHRVARAIIGAIPVLSGTVLEVFNALIEPPLEKRKREWMLEVTKIVNELQSKFNLDIESLATNDQFISILLNASQIAVRNHQSFKIKSLRTALINSAKNTRLSDDQQFIFLKLLDEFTVPHIKILEATVSGFCWSPKTAAPGHVVWLEFSRILLSEFKEFDDKADLLYQLVSDLEYKKLLRTFPVQHVQELSNGELSVTGSSEWGQFMSFKPGKTHRLEARSEHKYVTLPTELGIEFLNYILCDE